MVSLRTKGRRHQGNHLLKIKIVEQIVRRRLEIARDEAKKELPLREATGLRIKEERAKLKPNWTVKQRRTGTQLTPILILRAELRYTDRIRKPQQVMVSQQEEINQPIRSPDTNTVPILRVEQCSHRRMN